jgi:hypothetical protein
VFILTQDCNKKNEENYIKRIEKMAQSDLGGVIF